MKKNKKYQITHLGKTLNTDHWYDLPEDKCLQLKAEGEARVSALVN